MKERKPFLDAIGAIGHAIELQVADDHHRTNEERIETVGRIHTDIIDPIDWNAMALEPMPAEPVPKRTHYNQALKEFKEYRPRFYQLPGQYARKKERLKELGKIAHKKDQAIIAKQKEEYSLSHSEWSNNVAVAQGVLSLNRDTVMEILRSCVPSIKQPRFVGLLGNTSSQLKGNMVSATVEVHEFGHIVPKYVTRILKSGKLSERSMPEKKGNELYRDYVASSALKVAGDIFALLPLDQALVTCSARLINPKTGHRELTPVLSVDFLRTKYEYLNLDYLDPSDALSNFKHKINFKVTKGMAPVSTLVDEY